MFQRRIRDADHLKAVCSYSLLLVYMLNKILSELTNNAQTSMKVSVMLFYKYSIILIYFHIYLKEKQTFHSRFQPFSLTSDIQDGARLKPGAWDYPALPREWPGLSARAITCHLLGCTLTAHWNASKRSRTWTRDSDVKICVSSSNLAIVLNTCSDGFEESWEEMQKGPSVVA